MWMFFVQSVYLHNQKFDNFIESWLSQSRSNIVFQLTGMYLCVTLRVCNGVFFVAVLG